MIAVSRAVFPAAVGLGLSAGRAMCLARPFAKRARSRAAPAPLPLGGWRGAVVPIAAVAPTTGSVFRIPGTALGCAVAGNEVVRVRGGTREVVDGTAWRFSAAIA
jgi:hypothetical protein